MGPACRLLAVSLVFASCTPVAVAAGDFAAPQPRMIELLRRQHHPHDWLYVNTASGRHEVRVEEIGSPGLLAPRARDHRPLGGTMEWREIERIDRRESRFRTGLVTGSILGAIAAGYIGAAIDNSSPSGSPAVQAAWIGIPLGAVAGGWIGARIGDRRVHARTLYVGQPSAPGVPAPVAGDAAPDPATARRVAAAGGQSVLRVEGRFGEFSGKVANIDASGLSGLRPDARFDRGTALPTEPVPWSDVTKVERLGTESGRYAAVGGVLGAIGLGSLGAAISAGFGGGPSDNVGGFALGAVAGALLGSGTGALIGANVHRWHSVYESPLGKAGPASATAD